MNHAASDRVVADGQRVFEAMADVAPVMIWQSGPDNLTTYFNRSWLDFTGRTVQQERVAKSLVQADQQPDSVRYNHLETVREYALEQLAASGVRPLIERRHATYILALAELAPSDVSDVTHAAGLELEEENLRAALGWALRERAAELTPGLAMAAYTLWYLRGRQAEGYTWLEQMLAPPGAADSASDHPVLQTALVRAEPPRWANTRLTSREREVIQLLSRGLSTRQIAAQLVISPGTVRSHLDHVMAKFDLHSRVQVVAWATQDRFDPGTSR